MDLSEKHNFNKTSKRFKSLDKICFLSKNLYNYALYTIKQEYEATGKIIWYHELDKLIKSTNQVDYRSLPACSAQQVLMQLNTNIKSYFKALESYKKNPEKFKGKPQFPNFKHKIKGRNIVIFTKSQLRINKTGYINFPITTGISPIKPINGTGNFQQVWVIPNSSHYTIEIVYRKQEIPLKENINKASIDLGINNLAALSFNNSKDSYIINGKPLKSINQYYNKLMAKYQSELPHKFFKKTNKETGEKTEEFKQLKYSNKTHKTCYKRKNKVNDYLHKSSKIIVEKLKENNVSELVIGYNKGWKQSINLGDKNNQTFTSIPHLRFVEMITYKCQLVGINVIKNEESYTSKCSAMDLEKICKKEKYLGTRIKRGLFKTQIGMLINADINGSLNIGRKVFGNSFVESYQSNIGCGYHPIKITA